MTGFGIRGRSGRVIGGIGVGLAALSWMGIGLAPAASGGVAGGRSAARHTPAGEPGNVVAIAAVPHSSDLWALVANGTTSCVAGKDYLLRRHDGHWTKVKAPKVGSCGQLTSIIAPTSHEVLLAGGRQAQKIQNIPSVWRYSSGHWVLQKTPEFCIGASDVEALAASSSHDVWAAGGMWPCPANDGQAMLRWGGKSWSSVSYPTPNNDGVRSISASAPNNAWALEDDGTFVQWNGKAWTQNTDVPSGSQINGIATSSPTLAYAVGSHQNPSTLKDGPTILRFNGKTWTTAPIAKGAGGVELSGVAISGKTAWAYGFRYNQAKDTTHPVIMRTTGGSWQVLKTTLPKSVSLYGISSVSSAHAFIAADIENEADRTLKTLVIEVTGKHVKLLATHT